MKLPLSSRSEVLHSIVGHLREVAVDPGEHRSIFWNVCVNGLIAGHLIPARLRTFLYRALGLDISPRALVRPGVIFRDSKVTIGAGSTVNYRCIFDNREGVIIGKGVGVGIGVIFLNTDHELANPKRRAGPSKWASVHVGDGVFIGSSVTILPGVNIARGSVIAAGAVVTRDCGPDGVYAGTPARRIRELPVHA